MAGADLCANRLQMEPCSGAPWGFYVRGRGSVRVPLGLARSRLLRRVFPLAVLPTTRAEGLPPRVLSPSAPRPASCLRSPRQPARQIARQLEEMVHKKDLDPAKPWV